MLMIGSHISSAKGYEAMGKQALKLGANTFAFFTRNPRGGSAKALDPEDVKRFLAIAKEHQFGTLVAHAPYTLNPCAAKPEVLEFTERAMREDLIRMEETPGNYYNFHPGSHVGQGEETGIRLIAGLLNRILTPEQHTTVLLETMAGKGSEVGGRFEDVYKRQANICPASMTLPEETLARIYRNAAAYERQGGSYLVGINMEGPFFSYEKRGAQNPAYLRAPDVQMVRRLQKEAGGLIKLVDVAPETEGALPFIEELKGEFRLSLAHTNADYDQAVEGFRAGATQVTHLYNAMSGMSHRAPGVVGAALENGECYVELICDGVHIVPPMIRNTFQMFGEDRIILISDSLSATGMPDGLYELGGQAVRVVDGKATIADTGAIAGSTSNLMDCLKFAVKKAKIPLESAVKCATINPAKSLGIDDEYGSIEPGKRAQLVFLDENLEVTAVWL